MKNKEENCTLKLISRFTGECLCQEYVRFLCTVVILERIFHGEAWVSNKLPIYGLHENPGLLAHSDIFDLRSDGRGKNGGFILTSSPTVA